MRGTFRILFQLCSIIITVITTSPTLYAQRTTDTLEAVLIPFHGAISSNSGYWSSEVWIRNDGDTPVDIYPVGFYLLSHCRSCIITISPAPSLNAKTTLYAFSDSLNEPRRPVELLHSSSTPGAFVWVEKEKVAQVVLSSAIRWRTRSDIRPATSVPIVPVTRFKRGPSSILGIVVDPADRYAYRIFGAPDTPAGTAVRVDVYVVRRDRLSGPAEELIGSEVQTFKDDFDSTLPPCVLGDCSTDELPLKPVYIESFSLPGLASGFPHSGDWVRVEFSPADPATRLWALVSTTSSMNIATIYTSTE